MVAAALSEGRVGQPTEEETRRLMGRVYARVRRNQVLGPVFARALGESDGAWEAHLARLSDFWSSLMLASGC